MTRTTPLRLMILQLRQIRLTDAFTFILDSLNFRFGNRPALDPGTDAAYRGAPYFVRNTIRARDRS